MNALLNNQHGQPGMYGASPHGNPQNYPADPLQSLQSSMTSKAQRGHKPFNGRGIFINILMPWIMFGVMSCTMSFSLHYKDPTFVIIVVILGFLAVGVTGYLAFDAVKKKKKKNAHQEPTWLIFLFITMLFAWVLGLVAGEINFKLNLEDYYHVTGFNTYLQLDPSTSHGQQLMDAGLVTFTNETKVDLSRAVSFMSSKLFCAAPIVNGAHPNWKATYDFWAVGVDCCPHNNFHCGDFKKHASGLRWMRDDQQAYFRLAVQQAEAKFNIRAEHPLFFHWMRDPMAKIAGHYDDGVQFYFYSLISHLLFQCFLVIVACVTFSKMSSRY